MPDLGIQLYSLHDVDDSLPTVIERVGETAFTSVEFAGVSDSDSVDELSTALRESGVEVAGAHVGIDALEDETGTIIEMYRSLGTESLIVPWLSPEHFESRTTVEATADRLSRLADRVEERGAQLQYHNHDHELVSLDGDGESALEILIGATDGVGFEIDLGWVGAAGHDPESFVERHAETITHVHVKDYDAAVGETVPIGQGDLDPDSCSETARKHGIEWLIYEAEDRPDSYETLTNGAEVLSGSV